MISFCSAEELRLKTKQYHDEERQLSLDNIRFTCEKAAEEGRTKQYFWISIYHWIDNEMEELLVSNGFKVKKNVKSFVLDWS